jgi:NADPH:quinone reductase-like Zn-dependent oxidoreductase
VTAFSCNYRDRALILYVNEKLAATEWRCIGSDFVGEVIAVGAGVKRLRVGDRVIPNDAYPDSGTAGAPPGLATTFASRRHLVLHEGKLLAAPPEMPDEVAAAFSLGAQTAYSMVRKLQLVRGARVLLTAANSNTSLFAANALKKHGVAVCALSTSSPADRDWGRLGVTSLIRVNPPAEPLHEHPAIKELVQAGGVDAVIDPYGDVYLGAIVGLMKQGARYVTCGLRDPYAAAAAKEEGRHGLSLGDVLAHAVVRNLTLMGNCLGQTKDLVEAIDDYRSGTFAVQVDSTYRGDRIAAFLDRTYNSRERFGKVVYHYDDTDDRVGGPLG